MRRRTPRGNACILIRVVILIWHHLYALLVWLRALGPPLVDITKLFSHTFNSLIHIFQSKQKKALICGVVLLTDQAYLYKIQWKFISRVPPCASREKDS